MKRDDAPTRHFLSAALVALVMGSGGGVVFGQPAEGDEPVGT